MSGGVSFNTSNKQAGAPTPVNTPLTTSVLSGGGLPPTLSRPTVPDVEEDAEEITTDNLGGFNRDVLSALVQDRIQNLIGRSSGYIESLPDPVKKTLEGLHGLDKEYRDVYKAFKKESLELEAKYAGLYAPVFTRRAAIVAGKAQPTSEDIEKGVKAQKEDDEEYTPIADSVAPAPEGVKDFWLTALRNHVGISEMVTERDEKALGALVDVRAKNLPTSTPGYTLEFEFVENEFFTNKLLTKTYYYEDELDYHGDYVYEKAEGCKIDWKDEEKNLTKSFEIKKQRNKNTNRTRLIRKAHPADSFFNFFEPPKLPAEDEDDDDVDEEELAELEERLELDYQIGEDLKERVIPRAIDFFTGKALEHEDFDDDDDDEDYEDIDGEDDDEDEDEDDDEDDGRNVFSRRAPKAATTAPNAEECKQQ
ncbi:nucleosome assembly protein [Auriculariales sp. MPI-PUGE-AT-0066]|nr:nucleosome assembly protein [Auriculariales sp. MPI-PUGE-AT-0066]